ncbi:von Willebrand factor D and EGF domain-containing protein [Fopius arisanus]|uniref:VWDE_2 protein n=1 Tax=Fopius arisanus TaxID=64838 RepID=A0A0C9Q7M1_9HYME|nr:PREDICTED: von Willebrand factor D and EGF domain-containing protein-like [Fopius arisanus]
MVLKQLHVLVFLLVGVFFASAQNVKGGPYQQTHNEAGYCYKRIPYHEALSLYNNNATYAPAGYGQPARPNWNDSLSNGYVTVLDCCEGYRKNPATGRCESGSNSCVGGCFGGSCVRGVCTCESGWIASEGICKPFCRNPCPVNAYCFAPDYCDCKLGWEKLPNGECKPICPGGCINGDCVAPKVCQCRPGYILNQQLQRCDAVCEGGCPHGECKAPGVCSCYPGYTNPPGDRETCRPDCQPLGCDNGQCISPGMCVCNIGYIKNLANYCTPDMTLCPRGCPANAGCVAPNLCVCNPGLTMDQQTNRCVPVGGYQPGSGGYKRPGSNNQTGGYQPYPGNYNPSGGYQPGSGDYTQGNYGNVHCDRPCVNGVCMGYNICSCNPGYEQDPLDPSRTHCIPSCPGGCPNGSCSAPNRCLCNPGYVKDRSVKGSQRCIPNY